MLSFNHVYVKIWNIHFHHQRDIKRFLSYIQGSLQHCLPSIYWCHSIFDRNLRIICSRILQGKQSNTICHLLRCCRDLVAKIPTAYLSRYLNLRNERAPGIAGSFSPPPTSKETASQRSLHASRHVRHAHVVMHVVIANPLWWGKRSRVSRRIRNPWVVTNESWIK